MKAGPFGHVHHIEVIVKLTIEAPEHHEAVADEDTGVPPPRFRQGVSDFQLAPGHGIDIELVYVIDIAVISTTQDDEATAIHSSGVPPSGRR